LTQIPDEQSDVLPQTFPSDSLHAPPEQVRDPVHALPQLPQFVFVFRATHADPQHVCPDAQQPVPHAGMPLAQVRQSVPPALQLAGLVHAVVVAAGQAPLLHVRALVFVLPLHDAVPHDVVFGLLVSPEQTGAPVVQEIVPPILHVLVEHAIPCMQVPHAPARQNIVDPVAGPQFIPSPTLVPRSLQTGAPLVHTYDPLWHLLVGVHGPVAQATHAFVLLQTIPVPQELPGDLFVLPSTQTDTPVVHDVTPFLHLFGLVVHGELGVQALHVPPLQ
jgi:hypothetical protein